MKKIRVMNFLLNSSFQSFRNTWLIQTVTAATLSTTFLVLGGAWVLFENVRGILLNSQGNSHISVYFVEGQGARAGHEASDRFCGRPYVKQCNYVSNDEARKRFAQKNPELKSAIASLDSNPFPGSLEIDLNPDFRDRQVLKNFSQELAAVSGVEFVDDGWNWLDRWLTFLTVADWAVWTLGLALALAMVFVVANTIKLVVYARRDEVDILHLAGASPWMIRFPFLVEGLLQGIVGASTALGILYLLYLYVRGQINSSFPGFWPVFSFLPWLRQLELIAFGAGMGLVGSALAVGRFLRS